MKTLRDVATREEVFARLSRLQPESRALWGKMNCHQMICHLSDSLQIGMGEKVASPASGLFQRTIMKWFALRVPLPWPKGIPTRPEVEQGRGGTQPGDFEQDRKTFVDTSTRFCQSRGNREASHPIFGPLSEEEWLRWAYLHADHHLRQFGV